MSDENRETVNSFKYGADAPEWAPAFWEGYEDFVDPFDAFTEAWDDFHGMGYTDLRALSDRLSERARAAQQKWFEASSEVEIPDEELPEGISGDMLEPVMKQQYSEELRRLSRLNSYLWNRAKAAGALLRYIEEKGPPPKWEDLTEEEQEGVDLPPRPYEQRLRAAHSVYEKGMGFMEVCDQAAQKVSVGASQVRKDLKSEFRDQYEVEGQVNARILPRLLHAEADRLGIKEENEVEKVEKVETEDST